MRPTVQDLIDILGQIAPDSLAEGWDNVGLLAGNSGQAITTILLALDPSLDLIDQALATGADVIITHHPVIFHPMRALRTDQPQGRILQEALRNDIAFIGCHTNLDATCDGVNDTLADHLGLQDAKPLVPGRSTEDGAVGLGRIGRVAEPLTPAALIARIRRTLAPPWLLEAGPRPDRVSQVAVCGGSCSDFAEIAKRMGADAYLTSEVKHATARWAEDAGLWLLDGGHFATENLAIPVLKQLLTDRAVAAGLSLHFHIANQRPPLTLVREETP